MCFELTSYGQGAKDSLSIAGACYTHGASFLFLSGREFARLERFRVHWGLHLGILHVLLHICFSVAKKWH